ncbi:MAG: FAD-binding oxidoreductase [Alphaproteobacteria bacterium]|nr:FAD-binding oxidoreductase [Alphaproteobacteria bacterium]
MLAIDHIQALSEIDHCRTIAAHDDIKKFCIPERGNEIGKTPLVLMPSTTEAVSAILSYCHQHQLEIMPQGGLTGLAGGSIPTASDTQIVLNLSRLNQMIQLKDGYATAQAGMVLSTFKDEVARKGRYFPLSYGSEQSAQLGGAVATNAGGINFLHYGGARQLLLKLKVVLMDGTILELGNTVPKDNCGYDIKDLFVGSEGTLGVITEVTFRLFNPRAQTYTSLVGLTEIEPLPQIFKQLKSGMGDSLTAFELINRQAFQLGFESYIKDHGDLALFDQSYPWYLLFECSTSSPYMNLQEMLILTLEADHSFINLEQVLLAENLEKAEALWSCRHRISDAAKHYPGITFDISVEDIDGFVKEFSTKITAIHSQLVPVIFGHAGDYNLHVHARNMSSKQDLSALEKQQLEDLVFAILTSMKEKKLGASLSAEHGIGRHKKRMLSSWVPQVHIQAMKGIKQLFDPQSLLHDGVIFDKD